MLERLKSLLLALLACSALFLFYQIWINESALLQQSSVTISDPAPELWELKPAAQPVAVSDYRDSRRMAALWDSESVNRVMPLLSQTLGEALGSAGVPQAVEAEEWKAALMKESVYLQYAHPVSLQALGAWSSAESSLSALARRILLSSQDGLWCIYYEDEAGRYFSCITAAPAHWPELDLPEPCFLAWRNPHESFQKLHPLTLLPQRDRKPPDVAVTLPAMTETVYALLRDIRIDPGTPFKNKEADGTVMYVDYLRLCLVSPTGFISYSNPAPEEHPLLAVTDIPEHGYIETTRALCQQLQPELGDGEWSLRMAETLPNGQTVILYSVLVGGYPVQGQSSAYARFVIEDGRLSEFAIQLKCYTLQQSVTALLPLAQALAPLKQTPVSLVMGYADEGGELLHGAWIQEGR